MKDYAEGGRKEVSAHSNVHGAYFEGASQKSRDATTRR